MEDPRGPRIERMNRIPVVSYKNELLVIGRVLLVLTGVNFVLRISSNY